MQQEQEPQKPVVEEPESEGTKDPAELPVDKPSDMPDPEDHRPAA